MKKRLFSFILALVMVATTFFGAAPSVKASEDVMSPSELEVLKDVNPVAGMHSNSRITDVSLYESHPVNVKRILTSATTKASMSKYDIGINEYVLAPITPAYSGWYGLIVRHQDLLMETSIY